MQSNQNQGDSQDNEAKSIGIHRLLWSTAGTFFLILGIIGIAVPLLPTTPFLLLALFCYFRGSKRMYMWMLRNRIFGKYLRDYHEKKIVPLKVKIGTISLLWIVISLTAIFLIDNMLLKILLLCVAVGVTVHILLMGRKKFRYRLP